MRKIVSFILLLCFVLGLVACSSGGKLPYITSGVADTSVTGTASGLTDAPETTAEITTRAEVIPDPPAEGTLLYYQGFEGVRSASNDTLLEALGWKKLNKTEGAATDGTATYSLKEYGNGKALYINNSAGTQHVQ